MSTDLRRLLRDLTDEAAGAAPPVDVARARSGLRRRRARAVAARAAGGAVAVGALVAGAVLVGGGSPGNVAPVAPATTAGPTRTVGSPCGATGVPAPSDEPGVAIRGAVVVGAVDPESGGFTGTGLGDTLWVDVAAAAEVPAGPSDGGDRAAVTTTLVDAAGTVAFWTDPGRELRGEATDGSGATLPDGLWAGTDCRTGEPLAGTYRAFATTGDPVAGGGETVELAPVTFGAGSGDLAGAWPDLVPTCGEPVPAGLVTGDADAELGLALDPGADLGGLRGGLRAGVTVTNTGDGRLTGRVPQAVHALLVDADGTVVSRVYDPTRGEYASGATFDVAPGGSFPAEVDQWFASCPDADRYGDVVAGEYDLYLYAVLLGAEDPADSPAPRIAVGGPYRVTLR